MKRYDDAMADNDMAVKLNPQNSFALLKRARLKLKLGDEDGYTIDYELYMKSLY